MAIITKGALTKGTPAIITLNKVDLAAVTKVTSDVYFNDQSNWKRIKVFFKSSVGNQTKLLVFNATHSSPTAVLSTSAKSRNLFEVQSIIIEDFDGGSLQLSRADLVAGDFDFSYSTGGGGPAKFSASLARSSMVVAADGLSISNTHSDYMYNAYLDKPLTIASGGKYIAEFEIVNSSSYLYFGGSFVSNVSEFATNNFGEISNGWPLMSSSPEGNKGFNYQNGGPLYIGTTSSGYTFGGFANGDKISVAIDLTNHKIWLGKNGTFAAGSDPATNTGGASFSVSQTLVYLGLSLSNGTVNVVTPTVIPAGFVQL